MCGFSGMTAKRLQQCSPLAAGRRTKAKGRGNFTRRQNGRHTHHWRRIRACAQSPRRTNSSSCANSPMGLMYAKPQQHRLCIANPESSSWIIAPEHVAPMSTLEISTLTALGQSLACYGSAPCMATEGNESRPNALRRPKARCIPIASFNGSPQL